MNIDRMEFIAWMERIMERFDILKEYVLNIQKQRHSIDGEQLLDNQDVLQMLKISHHSLQHTARPASYRITPSAGSCTTSYGMYLDSSGIVSLTLTANERKQVTNITD